MKRQIKRRNEMVTKKRKIYEKERTKKKEKVRGMIKEIKNERKKLKLKR